MHSPLLDEQRCLRLLEWLDPSRLEEHSVSRESICSLMELFRAGDAVGARSPLQIELILRSLNPSSGKRQVKALL